MSLLRAEAGWLLERATREEVGEQKRAGDRNADDHAADQRRLGAFSGREVDHGEHNEGADAEKQGAKQRPGADEMPHGSPRARPSHCA